MLLSQVRLNHGVPIGNRQLKLPVNAVLDDALGDEPTRPACQGDRSRHTDSHEQAELEDDRVRPPSLRERAILDGVLFA